MTENVTPHPRPVPTTDGPPQVFVLQGHLTAEQKTWRKVRIVPSGSDGAGLLVPVEAPDPTAPPVTPQAVLAAVADMLAAGYAGSAEAIFAKLRTSGLSLKPVIGDDGVLHVTIASA